MRTFRAVFAGRHEERRVLQHAIESAAASRAQAVLIQGVAGTGKSKLLEYAASLAAQHRLTVLLGQADEGQERTPYHVFLDVFRRRIRTDGGQVASWMQPSSPWTQLVTFRAASGLQGPQHAFHEIFEALQRLDAPVMLALEDLHWADQASLAILEWLVREFTTKPFLVVATVRSEALTARPANHDAIERLVRRPGVRLLRLDGLSLVETREVVEAALGDAGQDTLLVRQLHRRTQGIPLFLEELLRAVEPGTAEAEAPLPRSFRDAMQRRFAGLTREDLRLLQLASVIGERFDVTTLGYLSRRTDTGVLDTLERFLDQQLIREGRERGEFQFWHALTRDVLYEDLLAPDRKALHRRIAQRWKAARGSTRLHSDIAYHLEKAGETAEAAHHYTLAAARAAALCAFGEAFAHGERAFAFAAEGSGRRALQASQYARLAGDIDVALAYCAKAEAALAPGDRVPQAEVLLQKSDLHWLKGDGHRAGELLRELSALREESGDDDDAPVWAWLLARQAQRAAVESRWADVVAPAQEAIAMGRRLHLPAAEAHATITLSLAEAVLHGRERAMASLRAGRSLAHQHGLVEEVCRSYVVEVDVVRRWGDFVSACDAACEGAERSRRAGAPVILFPALATSAVELLWRTGRWQEALDRMAETERLVNEQASTLVRCHFRATLASIALARERLDEAQAHLAVAMQLAAVIHEAQWTLPVHGVAAQLALARHRPREALQALLDARGRFPDAEAAEVAELVALGLEALLQHTHEGSNRHSEMQAALVLPPWASGVADWQEPRVTGLRALLDGNTSAAAAALRRAAEDAAARQCPIDEARAREALAAALQRQGHAEAKTEAVRERTRAQALLAGIPGRTLHIDPALGILSAREREVARLVADGLANKQVGARLAISERTVAVHLSRIFEKTGVDSRHQLSTLILGHGKR